MPGRGWTRMLLGGIPVLVLVACTPTVGAPTPTPTATASAGADGALLAPWPSLTAGCPELVPAQPVLDLFPDPVVPVEAAAGIAADPRAVVLAQIGGLECAWADDPTSTPRDANHWLQVSLLPDAAGTYDELFGHVVDLQYSIVDTMGDDSVLSCSDWGCTLDIRIDDIWASLWVNTTGNEEVALERRMQTLGSALVQRIRDSPRAADLWVRPDGGWEGWGICESDDVAAALGRSFGIPDAVQAGGDFDDVFGTAQHRAGLSHCPAYDEASYRGISASFIPGGEWAWKDSIEAVPFVFDDLEYQPAGSGDVSTLVACDAERCNSVSRYGGGLVTVFGHGFDRQGFTAGVLAFVSELDALR